MFSRLGKALACATMAASTIGLFAAPAQAASAVKESAAAPMYWSYGCEYGHACLRLTVEDQADSWWNVDHCGSNSIHDYFDYTIANGNGFTVYYQDGTWDYTAPWTQRRIDGQNLAVLVYVDC